MYMTNCKKLIHGLACAISILVVGLNILAQAKISTPSYKIARLKIQTFNPVFDIFSEDISDKKDNEFWNAINLSLFVTVEVSGKAGSYVSERRVEVTAYEGRKLILRRVTNLGVINNSGMYYVPVWLYGGFCQSVTIKARFLGQRQASVIKKSIFFHCGE